MRALTLHGCWAWAVAHAGKDIENRVWEIPRAHLGTRIAIHAGSNPGSASARARVAESCHQTPVRYPAQVIVATALLAGCVEGSDSPWYIGPYGWLLRDVRRLDTPIACKGALGLWVVPPTIASRLP